MFEKDIKITGKHAAYIKFLSKKTAELKKDFKGAEIFKRYLDVYMVGAILGAVKNRKAEVDSSESSETATLFASQVVGEQANLKFIYRLIMLTDKNSDFSDDEKIDSAFRYDTDNEKVAQGMDVFNAYARGGIEWLYEKFTDGATTHDDYLQRLYEIVDEFNGDYNQ